MKKLLLVPVFLMTFLVSSFLQQGFAQTVIDFNSPVTAPNPPVDQLIPKQLTVEGFTFAANLTNQYGLGFYDDIGAGGTRALSDNNVPAGALTIWTITRVGGSEFQFISIFINRRLGSASGTIRGYKNGNPTGPSKPITFDGIQSFASDPDFYDVDEIRIEALDINVALDNFTYGSVFTGPVNAAPVATPPIAPTVQEDAVGVLLADNIQIEDTDGDNQTVTFTITGGTVSLGTSGITFGGGGNGSSSFTASGTLVAINSALDAATFTPTPNLFGTNAGSISFVSNDGTVNSNPATVTFNISGVNDAPTFTGLPSSITVLEDAVNAELSGALSSGTFADVDAGSNNVTLTLSVNQGTLNYANPEGTGVTITGQGTSTGTFTGTVQNIETFLNTNTNVAYTPPVNLSGVNAATLTVSANDNGNTGAGGGQTLVLGQIQINITPVNDAPIATAPTAPSVTENDVNVALSDDIQIVDVDGDNQTVTFTITGGTVSLGTAGITFGGGGNGSASFTASGTLAAINTALDAATFTPTPNLFGTGAGTISFVSNDGTVNSNQALVTFNIIEAVNQGPSIDNGRRIDYRENDPPLSFSSGGAIAVLSNGVNISEAVITFLDPIVGDVVAVGDAGPYSVSTVNDVITLLGSGTAEEMSAALNSLTYVHNGDDPTRANSDGSRGVEIFVEDALGRLSPTLKVDIIIESVNDAPVVNVPSTIAVTENLPSPLTGISFSDVDAGTNTVRALFIVNNGGILNAEGRSGITVSTPSGGLELRGSISNINSFIADGELTFTTALNSLSDVTLSILIDDLGNTGSGGNLTDSENVTLEVTDANTAPIDLTLSNTTVAENSAIGTAVGTFSAVDANSGETFTYSFVTGEGADDNGAFSISGDELQTATVFDFETKSTYTIRVRVTDSGSLFFERQFTINVNNVNEAPTVTAPLTIAVFEDEPQALTGISFSDVDAGSNAVTATFSVASGTLSATNGGGVTVGGTSSELTLSGVINDINTFISANNLEFITALNSTSDVTLAINISDDGNTGSGEAETAQASVTIEVTAVNDAPINSVPGSQATDQDVALVFSSGNGNLISVSDVDAGGAPIRISLTATNGVLSLLSSTGLSFTTGTETNSSSMVFTGTLANVNTALNGLTFTPNPGYSGTASLTIISNDQGFSGSGPETGQTDTDIVAITVNSISPVVTRVTSSTDDGLYKEGDEISIQVIFDQAVEVNTDGGIPSLTLETGIVDRVASYVSGSGTTTLNFSYTVQAGDASNDLDYASVNALILNGAVIENSSNDPASLVLPALGSANSISGQKNLVIDTAIPVVISVLPPANGVYRIDQNLDFAVSLSEAVVVSGFPQLSLTIGASTAQASYLSGSGSNVLVFRYTVQSGDLDLNGITVGILSLNTGTIQDAAGNNANLTINNIGSTSQVLVDGVPPTVVSMILNDNSLAIGQTATLTVAFSERISGLEITDFTVANGALSGLTSADGGETWTATFTPTSNVQDATNVISLDNEGYTDLAGNVGTGTTESFNYEIDTQRPSATIVVDDTELTSGETSLVTITFTEAVTGLMLDDFTVENGILSDLESGDGGITWTATLTPDLSVEDATNVIQLDNMGYQDLAGNTGSETTESNTYSVDTQIPAGYSVTIVPNRINGVNQNNFSFNLLDGEIGATYSFTISSSAGGTSVTGNGSVSSSNQLIEAINVSGLLDGVLTLSLSLTDPSGNEGEEVSDSVEKLLPAVLTVTVKTQAGENNATDGEFEIVTDNLFATNTTVTIQVGGTASPGSDYQTLGTSFNFPGNTPSVLLPVSIIDDLNVEGEETIILTLTGTDNDLVSIGTPSEATMTISDDDVATELIITPTAGQNKEYGDADPVEYAYTVEGFKNGDTISILEGDLSREEGEDAGTYPYEIGDLDAGPNYILVLNPAVFTITPATLSIEVGQLEKVYGAEDPVYSFTPSGFKLNDTAAILEGALRRTAGENVGTYPYNLGTLSAGDNYNLQLISTTPFLITPAPLKLIADNKQKTFGAANPPLTFTYDGLVNGDTQIQTEPTLGTTAIETSPVGNYPITVTGGFDPNYSISRVEGTLSIGQKTVTIRADDQSKVYGQENPILTFSYTGLLEGDTQIQNEPTISTTATASSNVGTYPITLSGGSDPNYAITLVNGTLAVGQKALTITADDKQKIYGEENPPLTFTYVGLVNGDTQVTTEPSIATTATASSNVGTYPITLSGGSDPNYAITLVNGTLTVGQKALTITADDKQKIYGEANPPLTFSYDGLVNGDTQVATEPSIATTATASSNVGTYPITLSGGSDQNYAITLVIGALTVGQKVVTITADDKQKIYGEANPPLTFSYNGLVNGDTKVTTEPSISTTATTSSNVGTYPITLSGGSDQNYSITLVNGTLTIGQKALTITADDKQKIYGEANPPLTFSYTGLVNGDAQVEILPAIATPATASSNVGTYPITLSGGSDQNYSITLVNGTLTIGQKALSIIADDKQKIYGEANPPLTFSYDGLVNGDTQVAILPSIATTATASSNVGTYPITLSGGADPNYAVTLVNGTLTIGQKALTITADDKQKIYGEANPPLTFSYTGLVNGDTQVAILPSIATTATASSNVGMYPITLSGGADENYAITLVNGTLTINPAILRITADAKSKIFGNADPELTFIASGFKLSDTEAILTGGLTRAQGETVGIYNILQGTLDAGSNYQIEFVGSELEIFPAQLAEFLTGGDITTPWSVEPVLPNQVSVLTQDGQILTYGVTWDRTTLNVFRRGTYTIFGTVNLPAGILNPSGQKAVLQVIVLPKPAPSDIILSNDSFIPDPNVFFQEIGFFTVLDEFDDIHTVELVPGASDNSYFEINSDILFWSSANDAAGVTEFTILVRVTDRDGNVIEKSFIITRDRKEIEAIEVFNTFSPNNDGVNDTWGIPDLKYFAGGRVQVFDRSGQRIFYTESPSERWDGTFEGKEMPVGTYFWVLESRETGEVRRGILTLLRE